MAIQYRLVPTPNPKGEKGKTYYRARVIKVDDYTPEAMAADVNNSTTMSEADVDGVLTAISKQLLKELLAGRTIVLKGIGRLTVGMDSRAIPEEEISKKGFRPTDYINSLHVNFIPEPRVKKLLNDKRNLKRIRKTPLQDEI